ncbi:PTS system galactose-specific transporter subunit IIB [Streptococcus pneumoniae]|nr:PTS system galactose-specific transporter subunit IIB [Streptococcus pneumoniae]CJA79302.1 PTS system galactose-specific transporter subunit IIB [Streptococcus pneumoniae]
MIKILAACGAGVNSSHQIKSALEEELSNRGYDVHCDAVKNAWSICLCVYFYITNYKQNKNIKKETKKNRK